MKLSHNPELMKKTIHYNYEKLIIVLNLHGNNRNIHLNIFLTKIYIEMCNEHFKFFRLKKLIDTCSTLTLFHQMLPKSLVSDRLRPCAMLRDKICVFEVNKYAIGEYSICNHVNVTSFTK